MIIGNTESYPDFSVRMKPASKNKNVQFLLKMAKENNFTINENTRTKVQRAMFCKLFENVRLFKHNRVKQPSTKLNINDYVVKHLFLEIAAIDKLVSTVSTFNNNLTWNFCESAAQIEPNSKFLKYSLIRQLSLTPNDPSLIYHLASYHYKNKSYEKAKILIDKALNLPGFIQKNTQRSVLLSMINIKINSDLDKNIDESLESAIFSLEKSKEDIEDTKMTARCYFNLAECYISKANKQPLHENRLECFNLAIEHLKSAIDFDFENDKYRLELVKAYYLVGEVVEAKRVMAEVSSNSVQFVLMNCLLYIANHCYREASEILKDYFTNNRKSYENYELQFIQVYCLIIKESGGVTDEPTLNLILGSIAKIRLLCLDSTKRANREMPPDDNILFYSNFEGLDCHEGNRTKSKKNKSKFLRSKKNKCFKDLMVLIDMAICFLKLKLSDRSDFKEEFQILKTELELNEDKNCILSQGIAALHLNTDKDLATVKIKEKVDELGANVYLMKKLSGLLITMQKWEEAKVYISRALNASPVEPGLS